MLGIDPRSSRELGALILALRDADKAVVKEVNAQSRKVITPAWKDAVQTNSPRHVEQLIFGNTAKSLVSSSQVKLRTASTMPKKLRDVDPRAFEFGANRNVVHTVRSRSRRGKPYTSKRHTSRQLPWKRKAGPTYNAAAEVIPRIASLWIATAVRTLHEVVEKR